MQDGIIKATGNSRTIYASLPATYAEFKAAVEAGTQALDISYNAAGWQQAPTFLNKTNLLTDAVAALFGLTPNATPNDALNAAAGLISTAQTTANGRARVATGSYTGTGTYGSDNKNSITFPFAPKLVVINVALNSGGARVCILSATKSTTSDVAGFSGWSYGKSAYNTAQIESVQGSLSGTTLTWFTSDSSYAQMNQSGFDYFYVAIG